MVVVNIFSKCATFMPAIVGCFKNVVKYWGLSRNIIIRDQDWKLLEGAIWDTSYGASLLQKFSSANRRPDRVCQYLSKCYLRKCAPEGLAQITRRRSFLTNYNRISPLGAHYLSWWRPAFVVGCFSWKEFGSLPSCKGWEEKLDTTKSYLDKVAKKIKKFSDRKRRPTDYQVVDMVLVKFTSRQFKALRGGLVSDHCKGWQDHLLDWVASTLQDPSGLLLKRPQAILWRQGRSKSKDEHP